MSAQGCALVGPRRVCQMSVQWRNGRIEPIRPGESVDSTDWGAFTTAGCDQGRPLLWSRHSHRLLSSLIELGAGDSLVLPTENELCDLLNAADLDGPARVRVVARRVGSKQWNIEASATPCDAFGPDLKPAGLTVDRWASVPPLVGHKTLARQPWNLARERARQKGAYDALLVDLADHLLESSVANVWVLRGRTVRTPRAPNHCLPGVVREWLLENLGGEGLEAEVSDLKLSDLATADEVWLSNAVVGVRRVCAVDDQRWREWPTFESLRGLGIPAPGW